MKRFFGLLLAIIMLISFTACSGPQPKYTVSDLDEAGFPIQVIPIYPQAQIYTFTALGEEFYVEYGYNGAVEAIVYYYQDGLDDSSITMLNQQATDNGGAVFTGLFGETGFRVEIAGEASSSEGLTLFGDSGGAATVVKISVEPGYPDSGGSITAVNSIGDPEIETVKTVDDYGDSLSAQDPKTGMRAEITVPAAAVNGEVEISMGFCDVGFTVPNAQAANRALYLDTSGYQDFKQPMEITISYESDDAVPIPCYIDEDTRELLPATIVEINTQDKTLTFLTAHASFFTWIFSPITRWIAPEASDYGITTPEASTDYLPSIDGFQERNQGSTYQSGGECFGMATFSLWYYQNKKSGNGDLYNAFHETIFGSFLDKYENIDTIYTQDIIATRAQRYTGANERSILNSAQSYNNSHENDDGEIVSDNTMALMSIVNSIAMLHQPVCVVFKGDDITLKNFDLTDGFDLSEDFTRPLGHALIAYRYETSGTEVHIYVYDCNRPGNNGMQLIYDLALDSFKVLIDNTRYQIDINKELYCIGPGSYNFNEPYERIYQDALTDFNNTAIHLEVTSHGNGDTVHDIVTTVEGYVDVNDELAQMGENVVDFVEVVTSDGSAYQKNIGSDGHFSIEIPLMPGENYLDFSVGYYASYANYTQERILDHDMYEDLRIDCDMNDVVMLVTLTWDDQPDVDLYVTDPDGDTAWYQQMVTRSGGVLDVDDTTAFGPEHFTLTFDDIVQWNQTYTVRLHYFAGNYPTRYELSIVYLSGGRYLKEEYTGVIDFSNTNNDYPGSSGGDWVDIARITPQYTAGTNLPTQQPDNDAYYIIPGSDSRYITIADLAGLSDDEVQLARNEIFARYGYNFKTAAIQNYFEQQSWYHNNPYYGYDANSPTLNQYEQANVTFIKEYEQSKGWDETKM